MISAHAHPGKNFWLTLALVNLAITALLGFTLRSKILFELPEINYRNVLSAHSHFAFGGWVGLALVILLIYDILPAEEHSRKVYQVILWSIEISSLGMAFTFPFLGYAAVPIFFSTAYIFAQLAFAWIFFRQVFKHPDVNVRWLSVSSVLSMLVSFLGPLGLSWILLTNSRDSNFYRDCLYFFLHFQYNGFFTLSIFALCYNWLYQQAVTHERSRSFAIVLSLSVIPSVFLALLWHNKIAYYLIAAAGSLLCLTTVILFLRILKVWRTRWRNAIARAFWIFSLSSFILKMLLLSGTVFPDLGNAVYGDRPAIIGFLHLVFLGFVSFYVLATIINEEERVAGSQAITLSLYIFACGIFLNEALLLFRGVGVLFNTNSALYDWLLWIAAILLVTGAMGIAAAKIARRSPAR